MDAEVLWDKPGSYFEIISVASASDDVTRILSFRVKGDHDRGSLKKVFDAVAVHLEAEAPVLFLNDMSAMGETSLSTKWYAAERLRTNRPLIRRSAVYGATANLVAAAGAILRVAGRHDIRLFAGKDDAIEWLIEG